MSLHPGLDIAALHSVSVFDAADWPRAPERTPAPLADEPALMPVRLPGVTWLPTLGLQVAADGRVPLEAIQDDWALGFERDRRFQGKADALAAPFDCDDVDADACILGNFYSRNFFHWITEELPKVHVLEAAGFDGLYVLGALPGFTFEFLELLGIPPARIVGSVARPQRYRAAWYLPALTARQLDRHPALFAGLRAALLDALGEAPPPSRRLWMDRRLSVNNPGRELVNPDAVYPVLARHGVEIVDMGGLPVREQLRASRSATLLSGPHGAGFIHAMFQAPRSQVIECYSPLFINPGIFEVCRLLRHRYQMVVHENCYGGYPYGNQLYVNPSQLELALQSLD